MVYIDRDFPTDVIDEIAWSESNSRKPIYHMHKWFARRVGCAFRAIIIATFASEDPMTLFYTRAILRNAAGKSPIILDPFMGGGTTLVEGYRLGCKTIGVDINPVAWFITKRELESIDIGRAREEFQRINSVIGRTVRSSYNTHCPRGHEAEIMYSFWVRSINCLHCGEEVSLFKSFLIARLPNDRGIYYCPYCRSITNLSQKKPICDCGESLDSGYATNKVYACTSCQEEGDITDAWLLSGEPPRETNFAIEYYCPECGRGYKTPDQYDLSKIDACRVKMEKRKKALMGNLIPDQRVPWALMSTMRPRCRVYEHFYDFFNSRQLLSLTAILREILRIEDNAIREFFILTFSDSINANNMFCIYNSRARKLEPLFGGHYFSPPMMPVENNVWGTKLGRGTFSKYFEKSIRASQYQKEPFEIQFRNNGKERERTRVFIENDHIAARIGTSYSDLMENSDTILRCKSSEKLEFLPDKSVDAVITDPPYYDNIMYSELSNLFYCWIRLGLKKDYPDIFEQRLSGRNLEILVQPKTGKGRDFYIESMVKVFTEMHRVLKDEGNMVFVFQHKKPEAWVALLQILVESNFFVTAVYPSYGETPSGVRAYGINYNAILVCKKANALRRAAGHKRSIEEEIDLEIHSASQRHPRLDSNDALMMALGTALQVYSQRIIVDSGLVFDLNTLGSLVQKSVARYWSSRE